MAENEHSRQFMKKFLNHRAWCEKCFTYTLINREAKLCEEGRGLQEKFLPLWDAEGKALMAIGKEKSDAIH